MVEALREATSLPFDIHLMVAEPERQVEFYTEAATVVNVHVEGDRPRQPHAGPDPAGRAEAGVCLNPGTPLAAVEESLPEVDQVMVMTINPGWGGQKLIPAQLEKVARLRALLDGGGHRARIEIDGGVKVENAATCAGGGGGRARLRE